MKPTNFEDMSCDPVSSNCIIWQGPDIPCIKLCKGDSISAVVAKLATELCTILDYLEVDNYNLDCFGLGNCGPNNFQELLQFLIDKLCPTDADGNVIPIDDCSALDCVVPIASCFQVIGSGSSLSLGDYVQAIGNRVCEIVLELETVNAINVNLATRITALENDVVQVKAAEVALPIITPLCVLGVGAPANSMEVVLQALEQQFCELRATTGIPNEILAAIAQQCSNLDELTGSGTLLNDPNWSLSATAAGALNNIWVTICDIRAAILNIQVNCCSSGCDGIEIDMTAQISPTFLTLYFTGVIPDGFVECSPGYQKLTITDCDGGQKKLNIGVLGSLNDLAGMGIPIASISPPINTACNLELSLLMCFRDPETGTECQSIVKHVLYNSVTCPTLVLTPGLITMDYNVTYAGIGSVDLLVEIWDLALNVLVSSDAYVGLVGPFNQLGQFTGLTPGTQYKVRTTVTVGTASTICPWVNGTTAGEPCSPATGVSSILIY